MIYTDDSDFQTQSQVKHNKKPKQIIFLVDIYIK